MLPFQNGCRLVLFLAFLVLASAGHTQEGASSSKSEEKTPEAPKAEQAGPAVHLDAPRPSPQPFPGASVVSSGGSGDAGTEPGSDAEDVKKDAEPPRRGEFIFAPIPFSNKAFAFGMAPVVDYVFRFDPKDKRSPPSSLVVAGMVATGGSWGIGGGGQLYLKRDRFRVTAFAGHGAVNYDVFGVGNAGGQAGQAIPIAQGGTLALAEVLVRLKGKLYLGPRFNYRVVTTRINLENTNVALPPGLDANELGRKFDSHAFGFKLLHDTRNNVFYPTDGHRAQFVGDFFNSTSSGGILPEQQLSYQNYQPSTNHYFPLSGKQVLALRGMICAVEGDAPFYELCQFGSFGDLRGYQAGRYRDRRMFAVQGEYRHVLAQRWGFVAFGGVGEVAPNWGSFTAGNLLPSGGAGIRFNLSKKERINLRLDMAYGKDGWAWNFSLLEAF